MELAPNFHDRREQSLRFRSGLGGGGLFRCLGIFEMRLRQFQRDPLVAVGPPLILVLGHPDRGVVDELLDVLRATEQHQAVTIDLVEHRHPLRHVRGSLLGLSRHHLVVDVEGGDVISHLLARLAFPHVSVNADATVPILLKECIEALGCGRERLFALGVLVGIGQTEIEVHGRDLESRGEPLAVQCCRFAFRNLASGLLALRRRSVDLGLKQSHGLVVLWPGIGQQLATFHQQSIAFRLVSQRECQCVLSTVQRDIARRELSLRRRTMSRELLQKLVEQHLGIDQILLFQVGVGSFLGGDAQTRGHLQVKRRLQFLGETGMRFDLLEIQHRQLAVAFVLQSAQKIEVLVFGATAPSEQPQHEAR